MLDHPKPGTRFRVKSTVLDPRQKACCAVRKGDIVFFHNLAANSANARTLGIGSDWWEVYLVVLDAPTPAHYRCFVEPSNCQLEEPVAEPLPVPPAYDEIARQESEEASAGAVGSFPPPTSPGLQVLIAQVKEDSEPRLTTDSTRIIGAKRGDKLHILGRRAPCGWYVVCSPDDGRAGWCPEDCLDIIQPAVVTGDSSWPDVTYLLIGVAKRDIEEDEDKIIVGARCGDELHVLSHTEPSSARMSIVSAPGSKKVGWFPRGELDIVEAGKLQGGYDTVHSRFTKLFEPSRHDLFTIKASVKSDNPLRKELLSVRRGDCVAFIKPASESRHAQWLGLGKDYWKVQMPVTLKIRFVKASNCELLQLATAGLQLTDPHPPAICDDALGSRSVGAVPSASGMAESQDNSTDRNVCDNPWDDPRLSRCWPRLLDISNVTVLRKFAVFRQLTSIKTAARLRHLNDVPAHNEELLHGAAEGGKASFKKLLLVLDDLGESCRELRDDLALLMPEAERPVPSVRRPVPSVAGNSTQQVPPTTRMPQQPPLVSAQERSLSAEASTGIVRWFIEASSRQGADINNLYACNFQATNNEAIHV